MIYFIKKTMIKICSKFNFWSYKGDKDYISELNTKAQQYNKLPQQVRQILGRN
jgi:hypothetical protein